MEKGKRETITSHFTNITASSINQTFQPPVIQGDYNKTDMKTTQLCGTNSKIRSGENVISSTKNLAVVDGVIEECSIYTPEYNDPSLQAFITSPTTMNLDFLPAQYGSVKLSTSVLPSTPMIIDNVSNRNCYDVLFTDTNITKLDRFNSKTGIAENPKSPAIDINLVECVVEECFVYAVENEDSSFHQTCIKSPPDMTLYSDTFLVDNGCKDASASPRLSTHTVIDKVSNTNCFIDHTYATSVVKPNVKRQMKLTLTKTVCEFCSKIDFQTELMSACLEPLLLKFCHSLMIQKNVVVQKKWKLSFQRVFLKMKKNMLSIQFSTVINTNKLIKTFFINRIQQQI